MQYVVCYDIADGRRRDRMAELLKDYGRRLQESVFLANLDGRDGKPRWIPRKGQEADIGMAIQCLHKSITLEALEAFGFSLSAQEFAARANELVDQKQGNSSDEANLHAMCGLGQSVVDCRRAVDRLLQQSKQAIKDAALASEHRTALRKVGEALHTVQDLAFHNLEPWPYRGILDAMISDPNYMICHAIRDLGTFSRLNLTDLPIGRFDFELTHRIGRDMFLSARFFTDWSGNSRPIGRLPESDSFAGTGVLLTVTFGAAPGSLPLPARPNSTPELSSGEPAVWALAMHGPAARARAENESRAYIEAVQRLTNQQERGPEAWSNFVRFRP